MVSEATGTCGAGTLPLGCHKSLRASDLRPQARESTTTCLHLQRQSITCASWQSNSGMTQQQPCLNQEPQRQCLRRSGSHEANRKCLVQFCGQRGRAGKRISFSRHGSLDVAPAKVLSKCLMSHMRNSLGQCLPCVFTRSSRSVPGRPQLHATQGLCCLDIANLALKANACQK